MPDIFVQPIENNPPVLKKPIHTHHLAAFCDHPEGITFENQDADEEILLFLRRHIITNIPWILLVIILLLLPPILSLFSPGITAAFFATLPNAFTQVFFIFYYLVVLTFILIQFMHWFFNISIITQKRIIDIDFSDLLYHDVAVTKLNLIEDTNYTQTGFIRSLFNYGDVFVQTAGEKLHFDFLAVPNPTTVVNIIQNLIGRKHA